jgi:hypothetical protein
MPVSLSLLVGGRDHPDGSRTNRSGVWKKLIDTLVNRLVFNNHKFLAGQPIGVFCSIVGGGIILQSYQPILNGLHHAKPITVEEILLLDSATGKVIQQHILFAHPFDGIAQSFKKIDDDRKVGTTGYNGQIPTVFR